MERVIYGKDPLLEVVLQIRFPKILALNNADPVEFQEAIKKEYPIYQLTLEQQGEIAFSADQNEIVPAIVQKQPVKNHNFISEDGTYKINLTSNFISISTLNYTRWEELKSRFDNPLKQFIKLYSPPFYERIGLRYIDAFSREKLGISDVPWRELISPEWLGAYSIVDETKVINTGVDAEYFLADSRSRAKIHSGIGNINNNPENVFILDSDFIHIDTIRIADSAKILEFLHDSAKNFIREAITNKLHYAMEPEQIE